MDSGDQLVPRESAVYREFVRLYRVARRIRPTSVDRWNGALYATSRGVWGSASPTTGAIRLSAQHVLPYLTGRTSHTHPGEQAEALATVLHEATHTGMNLKAQSEPNAVYSEHSAGLTEGVAELRVMADFDAFADLAGYQELVLPRPQYPGAHAASDRLLDQAAGLNVNRKALLNRLIAGPAVMHFDALADGVVRNRLWDVVPHHPTHQHTVRAALIQPMIHLAWPKLPDHSAPLGARIADEIRSDLNAKVDEIRRHYRLGGAGPFGDDLRVRGIAEVRAEPAQVDTLRFLSAQAPATGAVAQRPRLGQGARRTGAGSGPVVRAPTASRPPGLET